MTALKKDPDAVLDYTVDWTAWLLTVVDTIASATWITNGGAVVTGGITTASPTHTTTKATVMVSGGVLDTTETLTCRVVTTGGRTDDRTIFLKIVSR